MNFAQITEIESLCFHLHGGANTWSLELSFLLSPSSAPSDMSTKNVPSLVTRLRVPGAVQGDVHRLLAIVGWDVGLVHRVLGVHLASSCHEDIETGSYSWRHR